MKKLNVILLFAATVAIIGYSSCSKETPQVDPDPGPAPCEEFTWYEDADGDGKGNPDVSIVDCDQPTGYVLDNTDPIDLAVSRTHVPMVVKISGETCPPCGGWGWTAWEELSSEFLGKGFCFTTYGTFVSNNFFADQQLDATNGGSSFIQEFQDRYWNTGSKPSFLANNMAFSGISGADDAGADANTSIADAPQVAAVLDAKIVGEELTLTSEVEFFDDMPGEYVVGAYLIEDKVKAYQAGYPDPNNAEHHLAMRGSLSDSPWGEEIVLNGAQAGDKHVTTFNVTLPSIYNKENLSYGVVVWRRLGTVNKVHLFVNSYTTQGK